MTTRVLERKLVLKGRMGIEQFRASLAQEAPSQDLSPALTALWWDGKGNWARAHGMVDQLETQEAMAVHAYLHRKEGEDWNADYWYGRAGKQFRRPTLEAEWEALVEGLLREPESESAGGEA